MHFSPSFLSLYLEIQENPLFIVGLALGRGSKKKLRVSTVPFSRLLRSCTYLESEENPPFVVGLALQISQSLFHSAPATHAVYYLLYFIPYSVVTFLAVLFLFFFFFFSLFCLCFVGGRGCGRRAAAPRRVRLACSTCKSAVSHRFSVCLLYCHKSTNADATHAQPLLLSSTAARHATAPCRMARKAAAMRRRSLRCAAAGVYMTSSYCYTAGLYLSHTTVSVACY